MIQVGITITITTRIIMHEIIINNKNKIKIKTIWYTGNNNCQIK